MKSSGCSKRFAAAAAAIRRWWHAAMEPTPVPGSSEGRKEKGAWGEKPPVRDAALSEPWTPCFAASDSLPRPRLRRSFFVAFCAAHNSAVGSCKTYVGPAVEDTTPPLKLNSENRVSMICNHVFPVFTLLINIINISSRCQQRFNFSATLHSLSITVCTYWR